MYALRLEGLRLLPRAPGQHPAIGSRGSDESDEAGPLAPRAFQLRANVSAYDACYAALAEHLDFELITADRRLARASEPLCPMHVLR